MNNATDWQTAAIILAAGLILGFLVIYSIRRKKTASVPKPRPVLKGFVWGVASTSIVAAIVFYGFIYKQQTPQQATDVEARIAQAKSDLNQNNLMGVYEQTNAVLAVDPNEPRALTYNAVVKIAMGQLDEAKTMLDRATARDPKLIDAWVALASLHAQAGRKDAASAAIDKAIAQRPDQEKQLRAVIASAPAVPESSMPPDHPPLKIDQGNAGAPIHITLAIESADAAKGGVVYVIARADGQNGGHPLAVKRVSTDSFPITIDLGSADSMIGAPLPALVNVEARLDADGDAATKEEGAPKAFATGVAAGATVALTLK